MDESTPCKNNPLGVKGVGELGTIGATPAVVKAAICVVRSTAMSRVSIAAIWVVVRAATSAPTIMCSHSTHALVLGLEVSCAPPTRL